MAGPNRLLGLYRANPGAMPGEGPLAPRWSPLSGWGLDGCHIPGGRMWQPFGLTGSTQILRYILL